MVRVAWRSALSYQGVHRQFGVGARRGWEPAQEPAQYPFKGQLNPGPNREIRMEHNMEVIHYRHLQRISQGHEHLSEQLWDLKDLELRNLRLLQKPNDPKANLRTQVTNEHWFHDDLPALQVYSRKCAPSQAIVGELLLVDVECVFELDPHVLYHMDGLDWQAGDDAGEWLFEEQLVKLFGGDCGIGNRPAKRRLDQ